MLPAPIWGTGKVYIPPLEEREGSAIDLFFSTGFSSFQGRGLRSLKSIFILSNIDRNERSSIYNKFPYRGLDLVKWTYQYSTNFGISRKLIIKTRYIIMLQRKIRKKNCE